MSPASEARRRPSSVTYPLLVAITVAFAVWCVHLMVTTSASRQRLSERITWLRELDALDLAASEDPGSSATSQRYADLRAALLAADPNPAIVTPPRPARPRDRPAAKIASTSPSTPSVASSAARTPRSPPSSVTPGTASTSPPSPPSSSPLAASAWSPSPAPAPATPRRLSRDLARSEARARAIIELAADPILTVDASGALISANKAAIDLLALDPKADDVSGDYGRLADHLPAVDRLLRSPPGAPARLSAKVGDQTIPVAVSIATIDQPGDRRAVVILRDIRDDIRAEEALRLAPRRRAAGQRGQERVPRQHEPRAAHPPQRDHRLRRADPRGGRGGGQRWPRRGPEQAARRRASPARPHRRHPRPLQDRSRPPRPLDRPDRRHGADHRGPGDRAPPSPPAKATPSRSTWSPSSARSSATAPASARSSSTSSANAAKYTEGGAIHLSVRRSGEAGRDWLVFEVRDTGVGISPEALSRLFGAFERGDRSTRRRYRGTGLGLAITQRLCEHMGGRVSVDSEVGRGSVFTVRLPARPGPATS
jgi:PAS domain-containing protein